MNDLIDVLKHIASVETYWDIDKATKWSDSLLESGCHWSPTYIFLQVKEERNRLRAKEIEMFGALLESEGAAQEAVKVLNEGGICPWLVSQLK